MSLILRLLEHAGPACREMGEAVIKLAMTPLGSFVIQGVTSLLID